jgi:glycosyltransferase involved in cell wall biosynthesis
MKISLITVSYNSAYTIRDTFESVLNQSFEDIEYIVIDGASKDSTIDIIKEYEPKFNGRMKWVSESDSGLYDAMNKGFKMATGDIIGIINSDDLFASDDAIANIINAFNENPDKDCVYADLFYVSKENTSKIIRKWVSGKQRKFRYGWHPAHPTFYLRKRIYERYGYFNLHFGFAADFELMLRFVEKYQVSMVYLPKPLVKMRLGGKTSKNILNIIKGNRECVMAFKENGINVSFLYPLYRILPKFKQFI